MHGLHPLSANKGRCLSVGADVLLQAILPLWTKEEREVPALPRSHPLLIEHLSLLVMDVRKCCSCLGTNERDGTEANTKTERCIQDGFKKSLKKEGNTPKVLNSQLTFT